MAFEKIWIANSLAKQQISQGQKLKSFESLWKSVHPTSKLWLWQSAAAAAAILLLALLVSSLLIPDLWHSPSETLVFSAPKGNISQVSLPDGSTIWLNSSTTATITTFGSKKVEVDLQGEAYFDVPHNESREFWVKTGQYQLLDLGTKFNVKYNPEDNHLSTALFEGAIEFRKDQKVLLDDLNPGTMFTVDLATKKIELAQADANFLTAWKEGKFVFVNKTLGQITSELESWYDVSFVFHDEKMKEERFSGVIKRRTSIENLLQVLKLSTKLNYDTKSNNDGSCVINIRNN